MIENQHRATTVSVIAGGYRQLFVDDQIVETMEDLERQMHSLQRYSKRPILPAPNPPPWEIGGVQMRGDPQWIPGEGVYKVWYVCYDGDPCKDISTTKLRVAMAISKDGIHWERPLLGCVKFHGQDTNLIEWGSTGGNYETGVIYDPEDSDPKRRYKTLIWAPPAFGDYWKAFGWYPIFSDDGVHWSDAVREQRIDNADCGYVVYDPNNKHWIFTGKIWYRADGDPAGPRKFGIRTSTDFEHWTKETMEKQRVLFEADQLDQQMGKEKLKAIFADPQKLHPILNNPKEYLTDFYEFTIIPYEGLYLAVIAVFNRSAVFPAGYPQAGNQPGMFHLQLATSRDISRHLKDWVRLGNREEFLPTSDKTKFDSGLVWLCNQPLPKGNDLWFYYMGCPRAHDLGESVVSQEPEGVGLAKLRRDGFVSLNANGKTGRLMTVPLRLNGDHLCINVNATGGRLRVALVDLNGASFPGFGFDDGFPVSGDQHAGCIVFRTPAKLPSEPVKIIFEITHAKLYSFWMQ